MSDIVKALSTAKFAFILFLILSVLQLPITAQETNEHEQAQQQESDQDYDRNFTLDEGEELPRNAASTEYHQQIEAVLADKDFSQKKTVTDWRWIDTADKKKREEKFPESIISFIEFLERHQNTIKTLATIFEFLLWGLAIALIAWLLLRYRETLYRFVTGGLSDNQEALPTTLLGLDVKKESLPKDIPTSAKHLWQQGEHRQAIALLLRASLVRLIHDHKVRLFDSDTENECCERIKQQAPKRSSVYMRELVNTWQTVAYAHQTPTEATFTQLCGEWPEVFNAK